jgi:hypothetical protein
MDAAPGASTTTTTRTPSDGARSSTDGARSSYMDATPGAYTTTTRTNLGAT